MGPIRHFSQLWKIYYKFIISTLFESIKENIYIFIPEKDFYIVLINWDLRSSERMAAKFRKRDAFIQMVISEQVF